MRSDAWRETAGHTETADGRPVVPPDRMLRWFVYDHLPADLQEVSHQFAQLAQALVARLKMGPERTVALRKLLEAKDAAVRQAIEDRGGPTT